MKEHAIITLIMLILGVSPSLQMTEGHKPLDSSADNNNDFTTAKEIPDHRISWAIYEEISGSDGAHYYKFTANRGDRLYAQISVPKLEKFSSFAPSIAVVGSNLTASSLERGYSAREYAQESGDLPFTLPTGMRAIVVDYDGPIPSGEFYEPFTQTSYWKRQEIIINSLPSGGTYYLIVFDKSLVQEIGKYTLAIGEIEDFSLLDFFTIIPSAWLDTKLFFEDYITPIIAISILIAASAITLTLIINRAKTRRRRDHPSKSLSTH
jgi:hypothetical protein